MKLQNKYSRKHKILLKLAEHTNNSPTVKLFIILFVYCLLQLPKNIYSQGVAINTTGVEADPSAQLDVSSTSKGVLISRMSTAQRDAITSPVQGLLIYNTTTKCVEFYDNSSWYTLGCTCTVPDIPVSIAGSGATETQITANWNAASGAASYSIDVSTVSDFSSFVAGYNDLNVGAVTTYDVTGLTCNTTYYYRIRAVNSCGTTGGSNSISYTTAACFACGSPFTDSRDSKSYSTVQIGTQCWMAQNLDVGTYVTGATVQSSGADNYDTSIEKYCYANNVANCTTYGGLYLWAEAVAYLNGATNTSSWSPAPSGNVQGICPSGWHLPTNTEFNTMVTFVSGAGHFKESGTSHWNSPNTGADNTSGFTALPGGMQQSGGFWDINTWGRWWEADQWNATDARAYCFTYDNSAGPNCGTYGKANGFSIRCIKD